jgi:glycosyltransferase involved in cell wall biosynthesis
MPDKKINVLFISSWFPNRIKPTAGKFVHRHAEAISQYSNVTVLHVCFDKNQRGSNFEIIEETKGNISIIYIYIKKQITILGKFVSYLKAYKKGFAIVSEKYGKIDIIHANVIFPSGLVVLFLRSYKKIPIVFTEHWSGYLPDNPRKIELWKKYIIKEIIRKSSYILPVSENLKRAMLRLGLKGKYQVIPNAVDTNIFTAHYRDIPSNKKILHISSLQDSSKNVSGILRVIKKLSAFRTDFSLHIISNGNQRPFIEQAENLSVLNKQAFFHSGKDTEEIAEIMHESDILILFSNYENLPCVLLEALSCGLPVIATDVGDISKYVKENYGQIVKPSDEEGLLYALDKMLDNLESYDRKSMHEFAEHKFSYKIVGKKFDDIYSDILQL